MNRPVAILSSGVFLAAPCSEQSPWGEGKKKPKKKKKQEKIIPPRWG